MLEHKFEEYGHVQLLQAVQNRVKRLEFEFQRSQSRAQLTEKKAQDLLMARKRHSADMLRLQEHSAAKLRNQQERQAKVKV